MAEIAATPWGLYVGTWSGRLFHLDNERRWYERGRREWRDRLVPRALAYIDADTDQLLVGLYFANDSRDTTFATIYRTLDRGRTWSPADGGLASSAPGDSRYRVFAEDLAVDPSNPQQLFLSNCNGILRSKDGGKSWHFVFGGFTFCAWHRTILIDSAGTGRVWVGGNGNLGTYPLVLSSNDSGETWHPDIPMCNGVYLETSVRALTRVWDVPDRVLFGGSTLYRSESGGVPGSWNCVAGPVGIAGFGKHDRADYAATAIVNSEVGPDGGVVELSTLGLFRSMDSGITWDSLGVPASAVAASVFANDAENQRLLIGTRSGIWSLVP